MRMISLATCLFVIALMGQAIGAESYVVLPRGNACALRIANVSIKSYRLLTPIEQIKNLANRSVAINVDVCECYLMGGNPQSCAFNKMMAVASPQKLSNQELRLLRGRMFLFLESKDEFSELYLALQSRSNADAIDLATRLLQSNGGATEPPPPPAPPPNDPSNGATSSNKPEDSKKRAPRCEVGPTFCMNSEKSTAEFEIKCEGFPTIIVTTDGKAGLKVGPLEVSITKH